MRGALALLALLALVAGCSERDRANPLDPANPTTGGRPSGFEALADFDLVRLQWNLPGSVAIDGFKLFRLAPGDTVWEPISVALPASTAYAIDSGVGNGKLYRYRLYYVIRGQLGNLPAEDEATPGPARPWVADWGANELLRLTADGRHVLARFTDAGALQSVAVDPATGVVWTASTGDGVVTARTPDGATPVVMTGLGQPYTIAVTPFDDSAWICELGGTVLHRNPDGSAGSPALITANQGLEYPTGVAVNPRDYSLWVCDHDAGTVRHFDRNGTPLGATRVAAPERAAVDSVTRITWVTSLDRGWVLRLSDTGGLLDSTSAARAPRGIAIDSYRGRAWVSDEGGNRVIALDPLSLAPLFTVSGLPGARDVAVDRATGDVWVVAESAHQVVHLDSNGRVLQVLGGFVDPIEVRVDPGL